MIEPKFRLISKINSKITNTLNNPWIEGFNPFENHICFLKNKDLHPSVDQVYKKFKANIGKETFVGNWEKIDQKVLINLQI